MAFPLYHNALSFSNGPPIVFPVATIPETKPEGTLFSLLSSNMSNHILAKLHKEIDSLEVKLQHDLTALTDGDIS